MDHFDLGDEIEQVIKRVLLLSFTILALTVLAADAQISSNLIPPLPSLQAPKGFVQIEIPLDAAYAGQEVAFTVQKPGKASMPLSLARRVFLETVRSITSAINSEHKINLKVHLILRLGEQRNFLYIHQPEGIVIGMKGWNDLMFARLLARAVPSCILTEHDADQAALEALRRAQATISVEDLKGD